MRLSTAIFSLACALGFTSAGVINYPFNFAPAPATVEECVANAYLLKIGYVRLNPNPPLKGEVLTIDAGGFLAEDIVDGATIDIIVKLGVVKLLTKTFQFCEESIKIGKECPVKAGDQSLQHSVELPKDIPPGKYTVNIKVKNPVPEGSEPGKDVTCLIVKAQFGL